MSGITTTAPPASTSEMSEPKVGFWKKWLPLFVMGLAIIIIVLDTTLLNVSLGTIVRELHTNILSLQWVITAYALTLAALTITGGRFGDLFGRKKMFMLGAIIFAIGSFVASISHNVGMLIVGESIIEGVGAALMLPATASLLVSTYRGRDRALALGVWGGMAAAGSAIGPVVGGYLTSHYSWRWGFRLNVGVAALLLIGSILVKEARDTKEKPTIDWWGVVLSATGLMGVVFAVIESATYGWFKAKSAFMIFGHAISFGGLSIVPISMLLGIVLLVGFYLWEQHMSKLGRTPLVAMKIFRNKQFTTGATLSAVMSIGQVGLIFGLPIFFQGVRGLDALHTGYGLLPMSAGLFIMAPLGGYFAKHFKPKHIVQLGLFINVISLLWLRQVMSVTAGPGTFIFPLLAYGAGMGLGYSQLTNITLSAVPVTESGEASGVNNTLRQLGSSFGTAIIGSIIITSIATGLASGVTKSLVISDSHRPAVAAVVQAQSSDLEFGIPLQGQELNHTEIVELKRISDASTVKADREAILFMAFFMLAAFTIASRIPSVELHLLERDHTAVAAH